MQTFRAYVTYRDESGTYSEGGEFVAAHWSEAMAFAQAKANDLVRSDVTNHKTIIARNDDGSVASFSVQSEGDGTTALITVTEG